MLPVAMVVEGVNAKLERTTRGGGIETLKGEFNSYMASPTFKLYGNGENSPEDRWSTSFAGKVAGKTFIADGAITVRSETLRQCKLELTLGGPVVQQSNVTPAMLPAAQPDVRFPGRFATMSGTQVIADIGEVDAAGKYLVKVTTNGQTIGGGDCGGAVEGSGSIAGNTLKIRKMSEGEVCELAMTLDTTGKLNIAESPGCSNLHGAACGFSDTLTRSR